MHTTVAMLVAEQDSEGRITGRFHSVVYRSSSTLKYNPVSAAIALAIGCAATKGIVYFCTAGIQPAVPLTKVVRRVKEETPEETWALDEIDSTGLKLMWPWPFDVKPVSPSDFLGAGQITHPSNVMKPTPYSDRLN